MALAARRDALGRGATLAAAALCTAAAAAAAGATALAVFAAIRVAVAGAAALLAVRVALAARRDALGRGAALAWHQIWVYGAGSGAGFYAEPLPQSRPGWTCLGILWISARGA